MTEQTGCFKPCSNWNTFNTLSDKKIDLLIKIKVLNLVINGIPSIQNLYIHCGQMIILGFKPCYKWTAFNTEKEGYIVNVFFLF